MAIAFVTSTGIDQSTSISGATGLNLTVTSTGGGNQGLVMARIGGTSGGGVVTDNGGGIWKVVPNFPLFDATNADELYLFLCTSLVAGTTQLTLNFTGSGSVRMAFHEYSVAAGKQLSPDRESHNFNGVITAGTSGQTVTSNSALTTGDANELLLGFFKTEAAQPNGAFTAGSGFTLREQRSKLFTEDQIVSSTGSYAATFTTTTSVAGEAGSAVLADIYTFSEVTPAPPPVATSWLFTA